jgi:hypothetical protein
MKKNLIYFLTFLLLGFLPALTVFAQAPDKFYFQAEARDSKGKPIEKATDLSVKITILAGSPSGSVVWEGYHYGVHTDDYGLFTLVIGEGTDGSHNFWAIDWANNSHYLNVQVDDEGSWVDMGTTQFLSVPYSKHATKADSVIFIAETDPQVGSNTKDYIPVWNGSALVSGFIYNEDTIIRMGMTTGRKALLDVQGYIHSSDYIHSNKGLRVGSTTGYYDGSIVLTYGTNLNIDNGTLFIDNENNRVGIGTTSPSKGLEVNDTVKAHYFIGDGSGLTGIIPFGGWSISGNAGTDPAVNFLGTTDDNPIVFRVNNNERMRLNRNGNLSFSGYNVFIGNEAGNSNDDGYFNTGIGFYALRNNTSGSYNIAIGDSTLLANQIGSQNTATGSRALRENTTGYGNTANGYMALWSNTIGNYNTAIGYRALVSSPFGSFNTATGYEALYYNRGDTNTAYGSRALYSNYGGYGNTANGNEALWRNHNGWNNTATGDGALKHNVNGKYNTATGNQALSLNMDGDYNTAVGHISGPTINNLTNTGAFGNNARVTASNTIRIGNDNITQIGGIVGWSNLSDGRFKRNITINVPGLEFVMKLRPVIFNWDLESLNQFQGIDKEDINENPEMLEAHREKGKKMYTGLIAQEVEQAAEEIGYDFSGIIKPGNEKSTYNLAYAEFVMPLIKAIQEQQQMIEELQQEIENLKNK